MEKIITLPGYPSIVTFTFHRGAAWARINTTHIKSKEEGMIELASAITELDKTGFTYLSTDHELGYYESVENITLEFYHPNFSKPKNVV